MVPNWEARLRMDLDGLSPEEVTPDWIADRLRKLLQTELRDAEFVCDDCGYHNFPFIWGVTLK